MRYARLKLEMTRLEDVEMRLVHIVNRDILVPPPLLLLNRYDNDLHAQLLNVVVMAVLLR